MRRLLRPALLALLLSLGTGLSAQPARLLPLGDPAYDWLARLHRHGLALELNPTALPYTFGEVREALDRLEGAETSPQARRWAERVRARVGTEASAAPDRLAVGAELAAGSAFATNDRLDPIRFSDAGSPTLQIGPLRAFTFATVQAWAASGPLVAQAGVRLDMAYNDDPDGLDVVNRLMGRNEEAYVGASGRAGALYLGRIARTWAPPGADALLISPNPRPFDQIAYRIGGERLALRGLLGELDSATRDGRFTGRAGDNDNIEGAKNRYLSLHRFDWRPSRKLMLSLQEGGLYSGESAGISLPYLLPTLLYAIAIDNTPKNVETNGLVAGALWAQAGQFTLQGQLLVDDVDILNRTEPASVALAGTLEMARLAPGVDAGLALTAVTARTYNTDQPPGRYVFALRGIGLPETDYVHARLFADAYLDRWVPGLVVSPEVQALWQGEADLRTQQVGLDARTILTGEPEQTLRVGARALLAPSPAWWLRLDGGINRTWSENHERGQRSLRFVGLVEAGARVRFGGSTPLGF